MGEKLLAVKSACVITPYEELRPGVVLALDGKVVAVGRPDHVAIPAEAQTLDVGERIVAPGFFDLHIHGAVGHLAGEGPEAVLEIARYLVSTGTTAWLPTVGNMSGVLGVVEARQRQKGGAWVAGIHMEGPYLAPKRLPHDEPVEPPVPTVKEFHSFSEAAQGRLKIMGVAPELDNSHQVIGAMRRAGVVPAVAHSKADYDTFMQAVAAGISHATHAFNVMTGMHHRRPGIVGGVLTCDQLTAELIADGFHVHPVAMDVLIRCKGPERVALITDSVRYQGLPDGDYGRVVKKGGIVRLKGYDSSVDNTMAGSVWPMNHNVANVARLVGLRKAVQMASLTPATIAGCADKKGSIEPGKDADLIVIDDQVRIHMTIMGGEVVYKASE